MICYALTLIKVLPETAEVLIKNLRRNGTFYDLKKKLSGYIGTSILESDISNDLLILDFFTTKYDLFESEISPIGIAPEDVLRRISCHYSTLGPFSFPPPDCSAEKPVSEGMTGEDSAESEADVKDAELVHD